MIETVKNIVQTCKKLNTKLDRESLLTYRIFLIFCSMVVVLPSLLIYFSFFGGRGVSGLYVVKFDVTLHEMPVTLSIHKI